MLDNNMLNDRIERLRRVLDDLNAQPQPAHIDLSDPSAVSKKQRELDELFELGQSGAPDGDSALGYLVLKRRKEAVLNLFAEAEDRFAAAYPGLCIPDELMRFNAPSAPLTFGALDKEYCIELAAAIWMLDYLKYSNTYEEASRYFPASRAQLDSVYLPLLSDSVHSDDELRSMLYVIRNRNRGMTGFDERCAFCDDADTGYKRTPGDAELPDRRSFDAIISLIDPEIIAACREGFTELILSYFDSLLSVISRLRGELTQSRHALKKGIEDLIGRYDMARTNAPSPLSVSAKDDIIRDLVKDAPAAELPDPAAQLDEIGRLEEKVQDASSAIDSAYCLHLLVPGWLDGKLPPDRSMESFADMTAPDIGDPYDVCFAFLSMLDMNDDHAWLYNLSCGVVAYACRLLPWADSGVIDPDADIDELRIDYEYLGSLVQKKPDWTEDQATGKLYDMFVPSPLLRERRADTSIAKLAFLTSGLIPPRTGISISFTKALLAETQLSPDAQDMIFNYFALAYSVSHKGSDFSTLDDDRIAGELSDDTEGAQDKDAEIKRLRAEVKHLKSVVNQMEHRGKDLSSELGDCRHKLEAANTELAELRSMIRESCDDEGSAPTVIDFPFKAERRTVIIGGHESWLKAIRPLLENVRYIGASEQPNPGVILNSEVVWIQSNAMGHSGFYKIIDIVRRNGIKVCYFKYASAEKCAEQLALEELGSGAEG